MATHRRLAPTSTPDYYVTPAWGMEALLKHETFSGEILEPCCGDGAMSKVLEAAGYTVYSSDLYDRGYGEVADFFDLRESYPNIITNPPFNLAEDMLDHALGIAEEKVAFLLRSAFIESKRRWQKFYSYRPPSRILAFSERLSIYPAGNPRESGGTTSYAWFIWNVYEQRRSPGTDTILSWIAPR